MICAAIELGKATSSPFEVSIPLGASKALYYSCEVGSHCSGGQILTVEVSKQTTVRWENPMAFKQMIASPGDVITFLYSTSHNVYAMRDAAALAACNFGGSMELGSTSASPYAYTVPAGTHGSSVYLSCDVGSHCTDGQVLTVIIPSDPAGTCVVNPDFVDGFGDRCASYANPTHPAYADRCNANVVNVCCACEEKFPITWVRNMAVQQIAAAVGDVVTFTYDSNHNVYQMKDAAAFAACDFSGGTLHAASRYRCDTNFAHANICVCVCPATELSGANGSPFSYTVPAGSTGLYFSCDVGDHCRDGQKLSVSVPGAMTGATAITWVTKMPVQQTAAASGDVLIFNYDSNHNVYQMKDAAAFAACDFTGGTSHATSRGFFDTILANTLIRMHAIVCVQRWS
jgi:plastocyanin